MSNFIRGAVVAIVLLVVLGVGLALLGFFPTNANSTPPKLERQVLMSVLDASIERRAPRVNNPIPPTDENLIEGMKIYVANCALCHGGLDRQHAVPGKALYPPAPSLLMYPIDDPEWHVFYAIRTGIRYTGMPAWEKVLSEQDIWKVTSFLTRVEKLPPAAQEFWKTSTAGTVAPPAAGEEHHHDHSDHK